MRLAFFFNNTCKQNTNTDWRNE